MSYDYAVLASAVRARLQVDPASTLVSMCDELGVDRHTVDRALLASVGMTFRQFRGQFRDEAIRTALHDRQIKSVKQAAVDAGYASAGSLARRTRRILGKPPTEIRKQD